MLTTVIELTDARKSVIQELIEDELSPYSQRLYRWRLKYQYKYFIKGGTSNDVPIFKGLRITVSDGVLVTLRNAAVLAILA